MKSSRHGRTAVVVSSSITVALLSGLLGSQLASAVTDSRVTAPAVGAATQTASTPGVDDRISAKKKKKKKNREKRKPPGFRDVG